MNHIELVTRLFDRIQHGLCSDHLLRRDRQNWKVAQELTFVRVQQCLEAIVRGEGLDDRGPDPSVKGTLMYLKLVWYYVEIFISPTASLYQRIVYAGFVTHFLGIWRNFILRHPDLDLKTNFVTRESYQDALLSVHTAVMIICFMRDNFPNHECRLDLSGSDCCEEFFSINGQWVGNHHTYNYAGMQQNVSHMIRLQSILVNPDAPNWAKAHIKQEKVWDKQVDADRERANLRLYPAPGEEITAWLAGIEMAKEKAREVGIQPDDDDNNNEDGHWFHIPFDHGDVDLDLMASDEDVERALNESESFSSTTDLQQSDGSQRPNNDAIRSDVSSDASDHLPDDEYQQLQHVLNDALEESENSVSQPTAMTATKISPTLNVPGHGQQYKSTLVKLLNENPKLSHDRLTRVRQSQAVLSSSSKSTAESSPSYTNSICLFDDYVAQVGEEIVIVRIARMRRKFTRTFTEYKQPVDMESSVLKDVMLVVNAYEKQGDYYKLDSKCMEICATSIVCPVAMDFVPDTGMYDTDAEQLNKIKQTMAEKEEKKKAAKSKETAKRKSANVSATDDGSVRTVRAASPNHTGNRRSKRTRTVIEFQISLCDWLHLYLSQYLHCEIALHLYRTCHMWISKLILFNFILIQNC